MKMCGFLSLSFIGLVSKDGIVPASLASRSDLTSLTLHMLFLMFSKISLAQCT
jgi:hypothetical protein